jgi:hypothetical protein
MKGNIMQRLFSLVACWFTVMAAPAMAGDADEILGMLDDFLANAGAQPAHERFWADDLVYTSSRGTRTTKAAILASFDSVDEDLPAPVYSAEDVKLNRYGDTAVVAFKLVATPPNDSPVDYYFNTGTFVKRDGEWRVVAWQATRIPPADDAGTP